MLDSRTSNKMSLLLPSNYVLSSTTISNSLINNLITCLYPSAIQTIWDQLKINKIRKKETSEITYFVETKTIQVEPIITAPNAIVAHTAKTFSKSHPLRKPDSLNLVRTTKSNFLIPTKCINEIN